MVKQWKEAFKALRKELPRLRSAIVGVSFDGPPFDSEVSKREMVDAVLELAGEFKGLDDLQLAYRDVGRDSQERTEVVRVCRERISMEDW